MFKTFNMGIGMVLIVKSQSAAKIRKRLAGSGLDSWVIGDVVGGKRKVKI